MMETKQRTALRPQGTGTAELTPLTGKLYTDFSIEALEERLETDPLLLSGLFSEITPYCSGCKKGGLECNQDHCHQCNGPGGNYESGCACNAVDDDVECFKF